MSLETVENIFTLLAVIIALLGCLFRYIDAPRRGYFLLCVYFLSHLLSDYYWTVYTLVMRDEPDISSFIAYLGYNISYVIILIAVINVHEPKARRYFHPLMLVPIPLNVYQFFLYNQYGGLFNNLWSGLFLTAASVICIQGIMYYVRHRKEGVHFPYLQTFILLHVMLEYGMWTASCFGWESDSTNPYYYCEFAVYTLGIFFAWAAGKDDEAKGLMTPEKNADDVKFQMRIQAAASFAILGVCAGGYYLAQWMKESLPQSADGGNVYGIIAVILFVLSVFLVLIILALIYVIALRYRTTKDVAARSDSDRRNRFNLVLTLLITLALMIFMVVYNSRIYYDVSVTRIIETGMDKAYSTADDLENYLTLAQSTLKVTADSIDIMVESGEPLEKVEEYLLKETENQAREFDENFTGIYAYIHGKYLDGLGWVPPEGYDPTERDWYKAAVEADGRTVIVSPYLDAQTGKVVVTISKLLSGSDSGEGYDVVALDVIVNHIQEVTEEADVGGKGYAMIVNEDGFIVAHHDSEYNGKYISEIFGNGFFEYLSNGDEGTKKTTIDGEECTVFVSTVMDQWYVVIIVRDSELLESAHSQVAVNIIVSLVIFSLISIFYYLGYKNEQAYGKKVEEMKIGRQKQEYEAEVLRLEKQAADAANKAKSGFLADMSHEIRTPINAILGMNEMILRETGEKGILEYARNIDSSGRSLLHLINDILDFSKIEDGKMDIVPVRYSVSTLITYVVNSISERARAKDLEFELIVDPMIPSELFGDDSRIEQIILNLLTNAVKYTPSGKVKLIMEARKRTANSVVLYVEVVDTGIGIKEEDIPKLFESFERLDVVKNRSVEGTGLGMSITTKLLGLMGSELKVKSKYGEGSVFSFELPQKIEDGKPLGDYKMSTITDDDLHSYTESFKAPDAHILIVDDTKMNILVAVNLLKTTKIRIDTAENGPEAIRLSKENQYDVILLDQRMPQMDGTETLAEIRKLENGLNRETPVICLTADAVRGARERYIAEGFTDYLTKPVEGRDLERILIKYLPDDKVIRAGEQPEGTGNKEAKGAADDDLARLEKAGFDIGEGLHYSQGDPGLYREIMIEFAGEGATKSGKLREYYEQKNWNDYSILIHSVKSSSKLIGVKDLSDVAAELEKASKEEDTATIEKLHDTALNRYDEVISAIRTNLAIDDDASSDEGDVLEFTPG